MRILSMSGFVPEQICDTVRFTQYTGERTISHYCGYASDFISQVIQDDSIDGAVYPKSCDSTRILTSYLSARGKFLYQINIPAYESFGGEDFFAESIKSYKAAVENYYGNSIDDIHCRAEKINLRNKAISQSYDQIREFSYTDYLEHIHHMLKKPLAEQEWKGDIKSGKASDKNVFLIGSFLSNIEIPRMIEQAGMTVVGDTLPESGRLASAQPVALSGDIYKEIAKSILSMRLSPTQNSFRKILEKDIEEIRKKAVKGVIFITQKYCESYDYLYSVYQPVLRSMGISVLQFSVNDTEDTGKAALALEAFADTL